jgi:hypothetical protein
MIFRLVQALKCLTRENTKKNEGVSKIWRDVLYNNIQQHFTFCCVKGEGETKSRACCKRNEQKQLRRCNTLIQARKSCL